jgi:hypothetical protein
MIKLDEKNSEMKIVIPISDMDELSKYQRGIMGILRKIEVGNCDPTMKEHLESVYELLSHLVLDESSLLRGKELLTRSKQGKLRKVMVQS